MVGANGGSTVVPGPKNMVLCNVVPRPLGMLKQAFLGRFEAVVVRFGPWKISKCLEKGLFWDQKWVQNGSEMRSSKVILDHLGCSNKCFWPVLARGDEFWATVFPKLP